MARDANTNAGRRRGRVASDCHSAIAVPSLQDCEVVPVIAEGLKENGPGPAVRIHVVVEDSVYPRSVREIRPSTVCAQWKSLGSAPLILHGTGTIPMQVYPFEVAPTVIVTSAGRFEIEKDCRSRTAPAAKVGRLVVPGSL